MCMVSVNYSLVATITLTSTVDGRQVACPREIVTYTCTVIQGATLTWTAAPALVDPTLARFLDTSPSGESRSCSDTPSIQCADLDYLATLTNVTNSMGNVADLTSTFRFTATAELNQTVVQCRAVTATTAPPATQTLIIAGEFWFPRNMYCWNTHRYCVYYFNFIAIASYKLPRAVQQYLSCYVTFASNGRTVL